MPTYSFPAHAIQPPPRRIPDVGLADLLRVPFIATRSLPEVGSQVALLLHSVGSALAQGDRAMAHRLLAAAADAGKMAFDGTGKDGLVPFTFDGKPGVGRGGPLHYSASEFLWLPVVLSALIVRKTDVLATAILFPSEWLGRTSSAQSDGYQAALAEALRSALSGAADLRERLTAAHAATEIARVSVGSPRLARFHRALVEVLDAIERRSQTDLDTAGWRALEAHRALVTRGTRRADLEGLFSLHVTGLAALAVDRGLSWSIETGYVPSWLVRGSAS